MGKRWRNSGGSRHPPLGQAAEYAVPGATPRDSLEAGARLIAMARTALLKHPKILVPIVLLALVGALLVNILTVDRRPAPAPLGASATVSGGLARIHGVIPLENDGWMPPTGSDTLANPPGKELHRVRILLELTAMEADGLTFDPAEYAVSSLGKARWKAVWASSGPKIAPQGDIVTTTLVFELPDRAIDLSLEMPGGPGLSLGTSHHKGSK